MLARPPLQKIYQALLNRFGPQHWWPAKTSAEVIIGAILVQNTAWANVEKAMANLRKVKAVNWRTIYQSSQDQLAIWIRPAGYFNVKAERLKRFADFLYENHAGSLRRLFALPTDELRTRLLAIKGIGPETADSILLYAANHPVFVVDAYTRRVMSRHGWVRNTIPYEELAALFTRQLPVAVAMYNEYHALLVRVAKEYCKARRPSCAGCPLHGYLPSSGPFV